MGMLLFVNKPITAVFYVLGLCFVILISFLDLEEPYIMFTPFWSIAAFSVFYFNAITYYYVFKGNEKFEIKGVDIRNFKGTVKAYWFMSFIGLLIGIIFYTCFNVIIGAAIFLTFYNVICAVVIRLVIYSKFISLALKKNPTIKNFEVDDLYGEIREILLKKVIG